MKNKFKMLIEKTGIQISDIIIIVVFLLLYFVELPYVVYTPGSVTNIRDRVVSKYEHYPNTGSFNTLSVKSRISNSITVLLTYIIPSWDLEKVEDVTYSNETIKEMNIRNEIYMEESNSSAMILALKKADIDYEITDIIHKIIIVSEFNNSGLKVGDEIKTVDGYKISNIEDMSEYINLQEVGYEINFSIRRDKKDLTILVPVLDIEGSKKVGLSTATIYKLKTDKEINIETKPKESGPSGGLITALTIYDELVEVNLAKGKKVTGTGTIDIDGNVGGIGGLKHKLLGASKSKVDLILIPNENLEEAKEVIKEHKLSLNIHGVDTFDDAVEVLLNN